MNYKGIEGPPVEISVFGISSPKTTYGELRGARGWNNSLTGKIGTDITTNLLQLLSDSEDQVRSVIRGMRRVVGSDNVLRGQDVINRAHAPTIGSISRDLECGLSSPEVIYMCGRIFVLEITGQIKAKDKILQQIERDEIIYQGEKSTKDHLVEERESRSKLEGFRSRVMTKSQIFLECTLPEPEAYRDILEGLLFKLSGKEQHNSVRKNVIGLVKKGEFILAQQRMNDFQPRYMSTFS